MPDLKVIGYTGPMDSLCPVLEYFCWWCSLTDEGYEAVVDDMRRHKYVFGGDYHQNGRNGIPVLSNGMVLGCSMRNWGGVMYEIATGKEDDGAGYCQYAWGCHQPNTPPDDRHIDPAEVERLFAEKCPDDYQFVLRRLKEREEPPSEEPPSEPLTPEQEERLRKVAKRVMDHTRGIMRQDSFAFSILPPEGNKEEQ